MAIIGKGKKATVISAGHISKLIGLVPSKVPHKYP
jgi:hypothetical protein